MRNVPQVGEKFGKLTMISERYKKSEGYVPYYAMFKCECGVVKEIPTRNITSKTDPTKSCGCLQKESARKGRIIPTIGEVFNRLTVVKDLGVISTEASKRERSRVLVDCSCGNKGIEVRYDSLRDGSTRSCGCLQRDIVIENKTTHGMTKTRTHSIWTSMKQRCSNHNNSAYPEYGGRGITYDPKWETFGGFFEDMGECPDGFTLYRKDPSEGYNKKNCRWTTPSMQVHNTRKRKSNGEYKVTSTFSGVSYDKKRDKWVARLQKKGKPCLRKRYDTEIEAAIAYDKKSLEIYRDEPNKKLIEEYLEKYKE